MNQIMPNRWKPLLGFTLPTIALVLGGVGLWLLLSPVQYTAVTRLKMQFDWDDGPTRYGYRYAMRASEQTICTYGLSNAVEGLYKERIETYPAESPERTAKALSYYRERIGFLPIVYMDNIVQITFTSEDPQEAAEVVNAVAEAYRDFRIQTRKEMIQKGIEVLSTLYQVEEKQINESQVKIDLLHQQLKVSESDTHTSHPPEQQIYWDEVSKLDQTIKMHKLVAAKIEAEKLDVESPKSGVQIVERAELPEKPSGPNRILGLVLLVTGVVFFLVGMARGKAARHQPA
jgi:hypothetical protein